MTNPSRFSATILVRRAAAGGLLVLPSVAWWTARDQPSWVAMWAVASSEFLALKLVTLAMANWRIISPSRAFAYVALWPGMDAGAFLFDRRGRIPVVRLGELGWALLKLLSGLLACVWATQYVDSGHALLVGWVGMIGIIFTLHFGLLHVISWWWRRIGVDAPPIMRAPIAADSLADFWGKRWNVAFADAARGLLFRPTVRWLGASWAGALVFLVSGLVHETVISLPARGGWGRPTLYFVLQAAGIAVEKSAGGKTLRLGCGFRGWAWMAFCTAVPLPLLFHAPFVHHVIVPFYQTLHDLIP